MSTSRRNRYDRAARKHLRARIRARIARTGDGDLLQEIYERETEAARLWPS